VRVQEHTELCTVFQETNAQEKLLLDGSEVAGTYTKLLEDLLEKTTHLLLVERDRKRCMVVYILSLLNHGFKTEFMVKAAATKPAAPRKNTQILPEKQKQYNTNRQFQPRWTLKHPLLRCDPILGMYCCSCRELGAKNSLATGVTGSRVTIQTADEHYFEAKGPHSCKAMLAHERSRLAIGQFLKESKCRYVNGKFCLFRTVHRVVKSFIAINQYHNICQLQRSNLVDLPMEHNTTEGCKDIMLSFSNVYSSKLTVVMQAADVVLTSIDETHTISNQKVAAHWVALWWQGNSTTQSLSQKNFFS
jgi:hypothetical protein